MINFAYRQLIGNYKGGNASLSSFADYLKIDSCLRELAIDLPSVDGRLKTVENAILDPTITNSNFDANSISGTVLLEGSIPASKLADNSITGSKLISNSLFGITDANISANANINPAKINLSAIPHSSLGGIGTLTHTQIETDLTALFNDVTLIASETDSHTVELGAIETFLGTRSLSTVATDVTAAINELAADISGISLAIPSGAFISGPTIQYHALRATGNPNEMQESPGILLKDNDATSHTLQGIDNLVIAASSGVSNSNSVHNSIVITNTSIAPTLDDELIVRSKGKLLISTAGGAGAQIQYQGGVTGGGGADNLAAHRFVMTSPGQFWIENEFGNPHLVVSAVGIKTYRDITPDTTSTKLGTPGDPFQQSHTVASVSDKIVLNTGRGSSLITSGNTNIFVADSAVTSSSLVFLQQTTPAAAAGQGALRVDSIAAASGFTVYTSDDSMAIADINFSYFMVNSSL